MSTSSRRVLAACFLLSTAACSVRETEPPSMTGPSELALRVAMQVVPDSILQDGASQAVLHIDASGADGRPARALPLRVAVLFDGVVQDFGTLSAKTLVTGDDGKARVTYTAPPRPASTSEQFNVVTLQVTPVGSDYTAGLAREVTLRLVTPGVLLPPNSAPQPDFTFSPSAPLPLMDIVFDASQSSDEGAPCGAACTYRWEFGDGNSASGVFVKHQFRTLGTYQVRLTVTDARGASTTIARPVQIGRGEPPTAAFTVSPTAIAVGQSIFFNAEASRAAAGRRIASYDWTFGPGRTGSGVTATHAYSTPGTYTVTLSVTDDAGEVGTTSNTVTVGTLTALTALLKVSPETTLATPGRIGSPFIFDASGSAGPSPITEYRFDAGDGSPVVVQAFPSREHRYASRGIFIVRVTVRDGAGRTAQTQASVYVE